jgi:sugar lactone lactonase YvrE
MRIRTIPYSEFCILNSVFFVFVLLITPLAAQAPPAQPAAAAPPAVWTITTDMSAPESAHYDALSKSVFVSSINGQIADKDGNGYISRLSPDGKVVNAKWATGLNAPKGLRSIGGTLWVSDIDEVVGVEIASGRITSRVAIEGARFLNDLATAPDGTIYVSDSQAFRIYAIKDGKASVFVEGEDAIETPNGVLVDGGRLIVGSLGRGVFGPPPTPGGRAGAPDAPPPGRGRGGPPGGGGRLFAFDLKTRQRTVITPEPIGGIDGIEPDGRGGYLVTDVFGSRILQVSSSGTTRTILQLAAAGADFGYIGAQRLAIVPYLFGNNVAAYDLTSALK